MEQNLFFNETCDAVDLTLCSQFYVDPCNCTKYYQCAQNQLRIFHRTCGPGTIYNHNILVCDYPNDAICQPLRPWERCNVTESRRKQLLLMCGNPSNSDQNTNGINVLVMQTILPTIFGVLVLAMLIGLVIYRYKRSCPSQGKYPLTPESSYESLDPSRMTRERIYTISDGSMGTRERPRRNGEIHLSDPYNSYHSFDSSTPEYCPSETQQFNPMYGVDPTQPSVSYTSPTMSQRNKSTAQYETPRDEDSSGSYISVRQSTPTVRLSRMPQPRDIQSANTLGETVSNEGSSYLIVGENDSAPRPSEIPGSSDDDREFTYRGVQNGNRPEGGIVSSEDDSYPIVGEPNSTPDPLAMSRPYDADREFTDRAIQRWNTQEEEIASSEDSSYELVLQSDPKGRPSVMAHPSDADREFTDRTVSSEGSAFVVVDKSDPLFHPYISGNGPWHHKVIFNTKEHYFPGHE